MLLRNPADYKGGFWLTYVVDNIVYKASSTESSTISLASQESGIGGLHLVLSHSPSESDSLKVKLDIKVWSHNTPILLVRHSATNLSKVPIEEMKLYYIMDLDVGGPASYKDDVGTYDPDSGIMCVRDNNPLCVVMTSRPKPDAWEISSPTQIRIDEESTDLSKNLTYGPKDIATALQWNIGNLIPDQSSVVDVVLIASDSLEGAKSLLPSAWELIKKKIR
ncbi:MAG: hypothetical protein ACFFEF_04585 [Candidatus Thorarchaeota archaeon]